jgi:transcriptional regulator with XRE-family HTH domain
VRLQYVSSPATLRIGEIIRATRYEQVILASEVAEKAGVSRAMISRLERGDLPNITVAAAERIFLALGFRLHVEAVPAWADVDTAIAEAAKQSLEERMAGWPADFPFIIRRFDGLPYLVGGLAAAALQGAPVVVEEVELQVLRDDQVLIKVARVLDGIGARRGPTGWETLDPRQKGSDRYKTPFGGIRLRLIDAFEPTLWMDIDPLPMDRLPLGEYPITRARVALVPLREVEATNSEAKRILDRMTPPG